jgi:hypothetical protein
LLLYKINKVAIEKDNLLQGGFGACFLNLFDSGDFAFQQHQDCQAYAPGIG